MNSEIIGRKKECDRLDECMNADQAQLVIVYGRRRVGKTYLINEYYENRFAFKITGAYGQPKEVQLKIFDTSLSRQKRNNKLNSKDWFDAFNNLRDYLETLDTNEKQVIFFDEMPWLDTQKSSFLAAFEWFWNDWASTRRNLVFIVCGSATSWMDEKIANNKGGLFNRQTCKLFLKPFSLNEVEEYLKYKNIEWSRYDIVQCYMIMGGIPYYLSLLNSKLSLSQNIDALFFTDRGELSDEFEHLYRTLFTNSASYIKVVEALSKKKGGLTREELLKATGRQTGGDLSVILKNLELSGFIRISNFFNKKKKNALYQLCDYYTSFYFKFIKENYGKDDHYWSNAVDNPAKRTWEGLVFEQICRDHVSSIKKRLGISGVLSEESSWYVKGDKEIHGAQIDLLISRRDHVTNLCEIKFSTGEYVIDKDYDLKLRNKIEAFRRDTSYKGTIQLVMITTFGLKKNQYSSLIQNQIVLNDLFSS
ncbi:ATP-binding protein [Succinivibrio sp.]|uniref:AAA family ATPase n=1 Tax=Succinivibrio sp. TaxID=2053619 RepID=UPI0025EDD994|nr:ATP-binding protein [Succinivibrio sp.]MBQ9220691.1 AAA family ATPase [Succinivibrio sp.]